jgi:hypothetical protein
MQVDMSHQNAEKAPRRRVDIARGLVPARDGKAQKAVLVSCRLFTFTTSRPPPNRQAEASSLLSKPLPQALQLPLQPTPSVRVLLVTDRRVPAFFARDKKNKPQVLNDFVLVAATRGNHCINL